MSCKNAEIRKQANVYPEDRVTGRTVISGSGEMKTLGVMPPGIYRFSTEVPEVLELTQGRCRVKLAAADWTEYAAGDRFSVPGNTHFEIEVMELLDYVCHFG